MTNHVKLYIGVPTAEFSRQAVFYDYLNFLEKPEGTIGASFHTNIAPLNRNLIIDDALAADCSHILFIDDDMAFGPKSLSELLKHDKDIVSGLYLNRIHPHTPVIFDLDSKGNFRRHYLQDNETGLLEVDGCGFGFMLVKTKIFHSMEHPFVRHGEIDVDRRNEDVGFCKRAKQAGFQVFCDLDVPVGHMGIATIWPNNIEGKWFTAIDTGGSELLSTRQPTSAIKTPLTLS